MILSSSNHRISGIQFNDLDLKKVGYEPFKAYGQSKTANVYMANEIDRRYGAKGTILTGLFHAYYPLLSGRKDVCSLTDQLENLCTTRSHQLNLCLSIAKALQRKQVEERAAFDESPLCTNIFQRLMISGIIASWHTLYLNG